MSKVVYEAPAPRYVLEFTEPLLNRHAWIKVEGFDYLRDAERAAREYVRENVSTKARVIDTWAMDS